MKNKQRLILKLCSLTALLLMVSGLSASLSSATNQPQVLVSVGDRDITSTELEQVINSSPVGTQFVSMDADRQAMIRGRMLKNLVYSELLYQEAVANKIDQREEVKKELHEFRQNLLYQRYLLSLRSLLKKQKEEDKEFKKRLKGEPDALAAVRSVNSSGKFLRIKAQRVIELGLKDNLKVFKEPLALGKRNPEAIVAQGDNILVRLKDLIYGDVKIETVDPETLLSRLDSEIEHRLMSHAADQEGMDVSKHLDIYKRDLMRQIVMQEREKSWVPNKQTLEDYYKAHPELSRVAEQWHIGQLIVKTKEEAEELRNKIIAGESLFKLAAEKSIDPYGRQEAGDMGWVRVDQASKPLREALKDLPENEISPVIKTKRGYHIVTILARKPGYQKPLRSVASGIRRSLILEKLSEDYVKLSKRYPVTWHLPDHKNQEEKAL